MEPPEPQISRTLQGFFTARCRQLEKLARISDREVVGSAPFCGDNCANYVKVNDLFAVQNPTSPRKDHLRQSISRAEFLISKAIVFALGAYFKHNWLFPLAETLVLKIFWWKEDSLRRGVCRDEGRFFSWSYSLNTERVLLETVAIKEWPHNLVLWNDRGFNMKMKTGISSFINKTK